MTSPLDLDAITAKWLQICGSCDAGIGECTHPEGDYRPVMLELVNALAEARAYVISMQRVVESARAYESARRYFEDLVAAEERAVNAYRKAGADGQA